MNDQWSLFTMCISSWLLKFVLTIYFICLLFQLIFIDEIDSICRKRTTREEEHTRRIKTELLKQVSIDFHFSRCKCTKRFYIFYCRWKERITPTTRKYFFFVLQIVLGSWTVRSWEDSKNEFTFLFQTSTEKKFLTDFS